MHPSTIGALLGSLLASTALAQAPVVTPAGDPSVRSDTIYALAVKPADYPDEPYVYLLDDGVVRLAADGRGTRTYRQVVQVLKQEAASQFGEQVFSYSRSHEKLTINWIRLVRPDGSVISDSAAHQQETDAPTTLAAPVYSDVRLHRATLGGVAPGTLVDWSYTIETLTPVAPGDIYSSWYVTPGRPVRRSRFLLDVPASLHPRIEEHNVRFERRITEAGGRRVYVWATADVPKRPEPEPFAADSDDYDAGIIVGSPGSWADVAQWYAGLARDRYGSTPELEARLAEVVAAQPSREDSLQALYRWVAQDFRYVSVALGLGGYQPRTPAEILGTKYADCKDKATLFITLARRMGFRAYPVLLNAVARIDSSVISVRQFNHVIVAVERPDGYLYLDPTAEAVPVGVLPASEAGAFALVVHPDGQGETVRLPLPPVSASRVETSLEGELSPDGSFAGRLTARYAGAAQLTLRASLSRDFPAAARAQFSRTMANAIFPGASGDSLHTFDGRDLAAPAVISLSLRGGKASSSAGSTDILTLPARPAVSPEVVANVDAHRPRHYHINAALVFGTGESTGTFRIRLPEGWRARLPADVSASSAFGAYASTYRQEGRDLIIARRTTGARGIFAADRVDELQAFLQAIARDDVRYVVLEHP